MSLLLGKSSSNSTHYHYINLFDQWNEISAYLFGYIEADGTILLKNGFKICFAVSERDNNYLEKLKNLTGFTGKTTIKNHYLKTGKHKTCTFTISSKQWQEKIGNSIRINKIPLMPKHLIHHYVRGYFDGDGSVYFDKSRTFVSFVFSSEQLANSLLDVIKQHVGYSHGMKVYKKNNAQCWYFRIAKQNLVNQFGNWLYQDATIYLKRKKDKFASQERLG